MNGLANVLLTLAAFLSGLAIQQTGDPRAVLRARVVECALGAACLVVALVLLVLR